MSPVAHATPPSGEPVTIDAVTVSTFLPEVSWSDTELRLALIDQLRDELSRSAADSGCRLVGVLHFNLEFDWDAGSTSDMWVLVTSRVERILDSQTRS